jgi:hypothetical protein
MSGLGGASGLIKPQGSSSTSSIDASSTSSIDASSLGLDPVNLGSSSSVLNSGGGTSGFDTSGMSIIDTSFSN